MGDSRNIYLNKIPLKEATDKFNQAIRTAGIDSTMDVELISVEDSLDRVTGKAVYAKRSSLHYTASAMDGIALNSQDTYGASEDRPVTLRLNKDFSYINTGQQIPAGLDAVIKIEDVIALNEDNSVIKKQDKLESAKKVKIFSAAYPGLNIRNIGEDIVSHQLILPVNHRIRPIDIGALLAGGITEIEVKKKPGVAIIPTGYELVEPGEDAKPGDILDYNSRMLKNYVKKWGGKPVVYPVVKDIKQDLVEVLKNSINENDIIAVIAGTSAGSRDYTPDAIKKLGDVLVHGIAMMPGKPTILGIIGKTPIIGLPGYPVSFVLAAWQFLMPLVYRKLGLFCPERKKVSVTVAKKIVSKLGNEEFLRVKLARKDKKIIAYPLSRGAGVVSSLVDADALVRISAFSEGLRQKEETEAELLIDDTDKIENTIFIIGSHDLALDILRNEVKKKMPAARIASFNTGSMGGLLALKQGISHIATSHLLDVKTGKYNEGFIKEILPGMNTVTVNLTHREQGLIVAPGNPKKINKLEDLTRPGIKFINRQKGSGTRVLLDYLLDKNNIKPDKIKGYRQEEYTHLMVASAVASGTADAALGIYSAARAFGLDFILLIKERYDLIIEKKNFSDDKIKGLIEIIRTDKFKDKIKKLGGYDLTHCGEVINK